MAKAAACWGVAAWTVAAVAAAVATPAVSAAAAQGLASGATVPPLKPLTPLTLAPLTLVSALSPSLPPQQVEVQGRSLAGESGAAAASPWLSVIDRDELDAFGDFSVLDLLQRLPAVSLDEDGPSLRGLGGGYTRILIDGQPAPTGFLLDALAPADIERIEIVQGPSAEFGGVAGVINIVLRQPTRSQRLLSASWGHSGGQWPSSMNLRWSDRIALGHPLPDPADRASAAPSLSWSLPLTASVGGRDTRSESERSSRTSAGQLTLQGVRSTDERQTQNLQLAPRLDLKLDARHQLIASWQWRMQQVDGQSLRRIETRQDANPASHLDPTLPALTTLVSHQDSSVAARTELLATQLQWIQNLAQGQKLELTSSLDSSLQRSATQRLDLAPQSSESFSSSRERKLLGGLRWASATRGGHRWTAGVDAERRSRRDLRRQLTDGIEQISSSTGVPFLTTLDRNTAYLQDSWAPAPGWGVLAGVRAEQHRLQQASEEGAVDQSFAAVSPVLSLRREFLLPADDRAKSLSVDSAKGQGAGQRQGQGQGQGKRSWQLGLSHSIRVPPVGLLVPQYLLNGTYDRSRSNTPIAADFAGNPQLRPERALGLDLRLDQSLPDGTAWRLGGFVRHIDHLIRRRIALETVDEADQPRWVSRPVNLGSARSIGIELSAKGPASAWLPTALAGWLESAGAAKLQLRAALSLYHSHVEQIDDPDARIEGQGPWALSLGLDQPRPIGELAYGLSLVLKPGFSTQSSDRQRLWRSSAHRLDAYLRWRFDARNQLGLSLSNALAVDSRSSSAVADLDGFAATLNTRRSHVAAVKLNFAGQF